MLNLPKILTDGAILSVAAVLLVFATFRWKPRLWVNDYPKSIQALVPPKSEAERRLSLIVGIPFLLLLAAVPLASALALKSQGVTALLPLAIHAFGVAFVFNLIDWLILDWLVFCTITPAMVVLPGTEGAPGYKDYGFHFRGFLIGTVVSAVAGLVLGALAWIL